MDAFAKKMYWKTQRRVALVSYICAALELLALALVINWLFNDLPTLTPEADDYTRLVLLMKAVWAMVPWAIAAIASFAVNLVDLKLRCEHCKHLLSRHEERTGEVHPCKAWHLDLWHLKLVRCGCPAFIPGDKL